MLYYLALLILANNFFASYQFFITEIFEFKYGGGSLGLEFKFDFGKADKHFKVHECNFEIREVKTSTSGTNSYKKQSHKRKMSGLQACTKYKVIITVKNLASNEIFDYENFVMTKPDKTSKIKLTKDNVSNSSVDLAWTTNTKGCLLNYDVTVTNDKKEVVSKIENIQSTSLTLNDLLPAHEYSVQVTGRDDKNSKLPSNDVNFKTNSSEMDMNSVDILLQVTKVYAHSAELMWNMSHAMANINYHLIVADDDGKIICNKNLTETSFVVKNLKACKWYNATIVALTKSSSAKFYTPFEKPSEVTKINYTWNDKKSIISWNKPEINADCVTEYKVKCQKARGNDSIPTFWTVTKNETTLVVDRLEYAKKIFINVYANWNTSQNSTRLIEFEHFNYDDFVVKGIREFRLSATELQLLWSFDSFYSNIFKEFQIEFNGNTMLTNKTLVNLNIEACEKNYTIIIRCMSISGNAGSNVTYQTHLNDNDVQLSALTDTDIHVEQTREKVLLSWTPNEHEAPCIDQYEIEFLNNISTHTEPKMELSELSPCITYQIDITPKSKSRRRGDTKQFEFTTDTLGKKTITIIGILFKLINE